MAGSDVPKAALYYQARASGVLEDEDAKGSPFSELGLRVCGHRPILCCTRFPVQEAEQPLVQNVMYNKQILRAS